jgi:hypothetical protein
MKYFLVQVLNGNRDVVFSRVFEKRPDLELVLTVARSAKELSRGQKDEVIEALLGWELPENGTVAHQLQVGRPSNGYTTMTEVPVILYAEAY